jgi:hypothetical protein
MMQFIIRDIYAGSELAVSKWIQENSAICDITGFPIEKITKDKLYQSAILNSILFVNLPYFLMLHVVEAVVVHALVQVRRHRRLNMQFCCFIP